MNNKVLKVLGITALLGLVGWYAYKKLHKCSCESISNGSASIGIGGSGSIGTNTYQTINGSGSIGVKIFKTKNPNDYVIVQQYGAASSKQITSATLSCGMLPNIEDVEKCIYQRLGQAQNIKVYKSAIGTSQYNNW